MSPFAARRWAAAILTLGGAALFAIVMGRRYASLAEAAYFSGWTLLAITLVLAAYSVRKKLPYPPLLSSSAWLQMHVYIGVLSAPVFLAHIWPLPPTGPLEITLAILFTALFLSGVLGLILSRIVPPRLSVRGEEVLFERIPVHRRRLRERAEELVVAAVREADATTLTDFYARHLAGSFGGPRHFWRHVCQAGGPRQRLIDELRSLDRYLDERERPLALELAEIIDAKDALDYHHAMQGVLKGWLFVHVPLTYVTLVFVAVHVVVVHTFAGAAT